MNSIRRHLTLSLCLLAALLLPCGVLAVYLLAQKFLIAQFDATLAARAEALISAAELDGTEIEIDPDVQQFAGFGSPLSGDFFEIRTSKGEVILRSPSLENQAYSFTTVPLQRSWRGNVLLPEGNPGRAAAFPFIPDRNQSASPIEFQLVVASDSTPLRQTVRAVLLVLLAAGTVGPIAAIILIRLGLKRGLLPLDALAAEVQQLNIDQPQLRLETGSLPVELRGVGEKLNLLLRRVQDSIARERRFSSHAAHELRTPLAELKLMIEAAARWPDEATPERCSEMLQVIHELERLLEKLSLLARADAGAYVPHLEQVDLQASIERVIEREAATVASRNLRISRAITTGPFQTDPVLWQTILTNLLNNAVAYAPHGSTILIEASPRSLIVQNPAPQISPADLDLLFERFWRKNTAREEGNHSGLGLAIVKSAVELLNGSCRAALVSGNLQILIGWK